jgi:hypothetical protein
MKGEYIEGPKALQNFKKGMTTLFKLPKEAVPQKGKAKRKQSTPSKG